MFLIKNKGAETWSKRFFLAQTQSQIWALAQKCATFLFFKNIKIW